MANIKPYDITSGETSPEAATTAITTCEPSTLGTVTGDIDSGDITIPRLNVVQSVGQLCDLFSPGGIVLNKETLLSSGTTPVEVTVLRCRKQFVENLPYGTEERPQVFDRLEDVKAAGGTIEWVGNIRPSYLPVLHVEALLRVPDGVEGSFPLEFGGKPYALALWTLRGMAYTRAARGILTAAKLSLRDGLYTGRWELTTTRTKVGRNSVFVPVLRNTGRHSAEFVDFVRSLNG